MLSLFAALAVLLFQQSPGKSAIRPPDPPPPVLSAQLIPGQTTVAPGQTVPLAVEIEISAPWHIYDPILIDTGSPTTIVFAPVKGVTFGPLRFPTPTLGGLGPADFRIEYLEHSGKFVVLTDLTVDAGVAPGTRFDLEARVEALACVEACVPVETSAKLALTVAAQPGGGSPPAVFEQAKQTQPPNLSEAEFLRGSRVFAKPEKVRIGEDFEIVVELTVARGHHVLDRTPGVDGLIPTRVFVESRGGLEIAEAGKQVWPEPRTRQYPALGEVREHSSTFAVRIPARITDERFPAGEVALNVLVQYQVCSDAGQCFRPMMARGVLRFTADTPNAPPAGSASGASASGASASAAGRSVAEVTLRGALLAIVLAFLGGLVLNVMPCVLPVISLKIVSFVEQAHHDPGRILRLGLAFGLGVMVWFWLLAAIAVLGSLQLRSVFQNPLQTPEIVLGIGSVIFLMALNMFGVFELTLPGSAAGKLDAASQGEGYFGAFAKGLLATLLGTACSAPFLAAGLAYAVTQPFAIGILIFSAAGVGMALPYVLLCANPSWVRFVPRPGLWMISFKQAMGFVLLLTAVWLLWVLRKQWFADGIIAVLIFWTFLSIGAWLIGKVRPNWSTGGALAAWVAALGLSASGYGYAFHYMFSRDSAGPPRVVSGPRGEFTPAELDAMVAEVRAADWSTIPWVHYEPGLAAALSRRGYTVYVDYTADWCATCKTNLATSLDIESTRALMRELGVIPIEADYTANDPEMRRDIEIDGQLSVPVNRVYAPNSPDRWTLLPNLLTPGLVHDALRAAGPSRPAEGGAAVARGDAAAQEPRSGQ